MGSPLRLTVVGVEPARAEHGWRTVSDTVEEIEQALSRFRASSDLVALNRRAGDSRRAPVHRRLYDALAAADRAWRLTGGAFDPRVLGDLERLGYGGEPVPSVGARGSRAMFDGGRWLLRDPQTRTVAVAAPVDLGGIGKGLALRWAFVALAAALPETAGDGCGALLDAGGDLVARGAAPQPGPWLVGIEDPRSGDEIAAITLADGAVCTSSVGVHAWQTADGRAVHHLIDPRTGEPGGEGLLAVTVASDDPAWTEVHSKTLFLGGAGGIGPLARGLGLAAWWVRDDGLLEMTPAARARTVWLEAEA